MPIDVQAVANWAFEGVVHTYTERDSCLYALGVGFGIDPLDAGDLPFVFEEPELRAVPTMAVVLAGPGFWVRDPRSGVDWTKVLHGEQGLELHRPLPAAATVIGRTKVRGVLDKGEGKGALILVERTLTNAATGERIATLTSTSFARGDGGQGGTLTEAPAPHALPDRNPDHVVDLPTLASSALIYRLSGDPNPLHASPEVARKAGFKAPILHGLCSLGVAGHAILRTCCANDPARFRSLKLRFSSPVYPGETLRTEIWQDGEQVSFRSKVVERDVVVLNNGLATVTT